MNTNKNKQVGGGVCELFKGQPRENYATQSRSIRILGQVTSIRLENKYWDILEKISEEEGKVRSAFISELYIDSLEMNLDLKNFTSILRVTCIVFLEEKLQDVFRC